MSDTNIDRDAIAHRIRSLLAKTVENGCTEAEALAAAQAARRIMDAHRLTQSDIEIEAEPIDDIWIERPTAQKLSAVDLCCSGISKYCGTQSWYEFKDGKRQWRVIGLKADTEMAKYLYQMLATTIASETNTYIRANPAQHDSYLSPAQNAHRTIRVKQSFSVGMANRIASRLHEMARAANATAKTSTGTALVVVKDHVVSEYFGGLGIKFSGSLGGPRARSESAYQAGQAAGSRVNLSRPVGGAAQGRIGREG